jgi:alkanesulfonate monooxygenase SsuD/methylene tetrahydromethanopterin reductase-like flavin-dependent oxidoreductase (luciferase family)
MPSAIRRPPSAVLAFVRSAICQAERMLDGGSVDREPLARSSVSLRLYPHDLAPADVVTELMAQARLAESAGFDGVMTSEHHGGFPNYVPNPLLATTWALDATDRIWAAPCPMLLPLRPVAQVIEDIAWTAQRFPGRVGAGFAAGALADDFVLSGVPFEEMRARFRAALPVAVAGLRGDADGPLADDPAVAALRSRAVPTVSAALSPAAARRAGALGVGLLFDSLISPERAAEVSAAHEETGGAGSRVLIRRVWVGTPPATVVATQMDRYRRVAPASAQERWGAGDSLVTSSDPAEIADRLVELLRATNCDALNIRLFQAGTTPAQVRDQIELVGGEVLPLLRSRGSGHA